MIYITKNKHGHTECIDLNEVAAMWVRPDFSIGFTFKRQHSNFYIALKDLQECEETIAKLIEMKQLLQVTVRPK